LKKAPPKGVTPAGPETLVRFRARDLNLDNEPVSEEGVDG